MATVDGLCGYASIRQCQARERLPLSSVHILREASALSVLLLRAIPEPLIAERATSTDLTLFLLH